MSSEPARDKLRAKRKELEEQLDEVGSGAGIAGIFITSCVFVLGYIGLVMLLGLEDTLDRGAGQWINITLICVLFGAGMVLPVVYIPRWLKWMYRASYRRAWRWLKHTGASRYIMEQELWEELFAVIEEHAWLKLTGVSVPRTLDAQLELASDFWPVVEALAGGDRRRLRWRVMWGSLTHFSDTAAVVLFNGCLVYALMLLSGVLLFLPLIPLYCGVLPMYAHRQGAQQALLDWLLDAPASWLGQVAPPPGPVKQHLASR
jgi:hypothetical protein